MSNATCPSDEELLDVAIDGREGPDLHAHIAACAACGKRLEAIRHVLAMMRETAEESGWSPENADEDAWGAVREDIPRSIGNFRIINRFDSGGQAETYRAYDPDLERDVVIKMYPRRVGRNETEWGDIKQEGKILAALKHPFVVGVHTVDIHEGRPYVMMEYVPGRNVRQYREQIAPREAARLTCKVAEGLAYAHKAGVIHRDIKPENIIVDENDNPRIVDFGIARLRDTWDEDTEEVGVAIGTPAFMAPEQAAGDGAKVSPQSDIFSLGSVLYYLLVGKAPFGDDDAYKSLERAASCDFDQGALCARGIPGGLRRICLRAMAIDPAERYARAEDFAKALQQFLLKRRVMLAGLVGAAMIVMAVGMIALMLSLVRTSAPLTPRLAIYHRVDEATRNVIDKNYGPLRATDVLELEASNEEGVFRYLLSVGGDGKAKIYSETDLLADKKGAWRWQPGPAPSETILLLMSWDKLPASKVAELESTVRKLGLPVRVERNQQVEWENRTWKSVESELEPRGSPLSRVSKGWADGLVTELIEQELYFSGRTLYVEEGGRG